eukprot:EG_transcript_28127
MVSFGLNAPGPGEWSKSCISLAALLNLPRMLLGWAVSIRRSSCGLEGNFSSRLRWPGAGVLDWTKVVRVPIEKLSFKPPRVGSTGLYAPLSGPLAGLANSSGRLCCAKMGAALSRLSGRLL